ncbi:hypothetical protein KUC_3631 [Vreelandella boliviensis LC1]|uniref:Uncharacterized protein n=1 Tax=Vreelandella boliviensis LC1 TaxID=1072583 RepID=A0A7U9BXU9_9GAMM|nr:hypothetical protein KUC_3631 [Halomonas boliviensis LC1]
MPKSTYLYIHSSFANFDTVFGTEGRINFALFECVRSLIKVA